jgi:dTDP-4-dehydrorhamnose reductase
MKVLLTGKNGQVGFELNRSLLPLGDVIALDRHEADLCKPDSLRKLVREIKPDVIVNAAAFTAVDKAEEEEKHAEVVNADAPGVLAQEAKRINALVVHYSTDYIFDGCKEGVYSEQDKPSPVNAYGRTKLAGEMALRSSGCKYLIFRTSWVFSSRGHNFLLTILKLAREKEKLSIVNDQFGAPTWARLIADVSAHCISSSIKDCKSGCFTSDLYHLSSVGVTSWHGFAERILDFGKRLPTTDIITAALIAIPSSEYPVPAKRPANSRLDTRKLENKFNLVMPSWDRSLELCIEELK